MTASLSGMTGPETTAAEQSRMELQARLNGLGGIGGRNLSPEAKAKKLREACEGFESIFIQKMWQEMRNAIPKTGLLSGREEKFWQDMYDRELSNSMTKAGGIGLADMMYEQLSRNLVSASRSAAGAAQGGVFTPAAAPLLREAAPEEGLTQQKLAASIYDGEAPETGGAESGQPDGNQAAQNPPAQPLQAAAAQPPQQVQAAAVQPAQPLQPAQAPQQAVAQNPVIPPLQAPLQTAQADQRAHPHRADLNQASGLLQAQKARRDAGDKLGSRAVRPSQRRRERQEQQVAQTPEPVLTGLSQAGGLRPGSPEALRAAMEAAKTGAAPAENSGQPLNLGNLVANVQTMNMAASAAAQPEAAPEADAPVTRKVRFSTNIPKSSGNRNKKHAKDAIRMLNVDNVGVNSKQGKGLAAYHAQQEALRESEQAARQAAQPVNQAQQQAAPIAPLQANQAPMAQAPIPPLTPAGKAANVEPNGNFAIPPLTAADSRG